MALTPIPTGTDTQVNTYTSSGQAYSSVAALNDGGFVVTWSSSGQDGSGWGIYGQRYAADGTPAGSEFAINQITAGNQVADTINIGSETVATLADGHLVQVWAGLLLEEVFFRLIDVPSANTVPTAVDDTAAVNEDATVTGNVLTDGTDDSDPDGDPLSVSAILAGTSGTATAVNATGDTVVSGAYGTLTIHADGSYSYAADADILDTLAPGAVTPPEVFTYTVSDGKGTDDATLTINVTALDDTASQSGGNGNDTLTGDTLRAETEDTLRGNNGNDTLSGLGGADTLHGGNGNDQLLGGSGRDALYGENGDDVLDGGEGNDVLDGGRGNDILTGGQGNDIIQFGLASGTDTINDFQVANDHIRLLDGLTLASTSGVVSDVNGDNVDDTTLTLVDGAGTVQGTVQVLGVSDVADWSALLVA